jgi:hypothetical protein
MRKFSILAAMLAGAVVSSPAKTQPAAEPTPPLYITFGVGAHQQEGDPDNRQAFYFSVPAGSTKPLFVRLFDPDSGGAYDQITTRGADTTTRFTVFGGKGADASTRPSTSLIP